MAIQSSMLSVPYSTGQWYLTTVGTVQYGPAVSYYWFRKLFESRHLWLRDDISQHVDTWLQEKDFDLCRAEEETRILVVIVVVTCQFVMVFGRLCVREVREGNEGVMGM